ncbi:asparagine synthase-related protein [Streptomyces sp. NPDC017964]|uniref:asparagine synthase-related protein n=1 Tax=Streptomyces sp. NPDC017964 TaxID=3365022 RepID=UPI0037AF29F6
MGLLLSGGLDSTWLGVEMSREGFAGPAFAARARTTATTSEPFEDDAPYADRVAQRLGLPLTWVDLDVDVLRWIPELVTTMELPFGDPTAVTLIEILRGYSALQGGGNGLLRSRAASGYSPCGRIPVPRTVRDLYARPCPAGDNQAGRVYRRAGGMSGLWSWRKTAGRTNVPRRSFGAAAVDEAESSLREE